MADHLRNACERRLRVGSSSDDLATPARLPLQWDGYIITPARIVSSKPCWPWRPPSVPCSTRLGGVHEMARAVRPHRRLHFKRTTVIMVGSPQLSPDTESARKSGLPADREAAGHPCRHSGLRRGVALRPGGFFGQTRRSLHVVLPVRIVGQRQRGCGGAHL